MGGIIIDIGHPGHYYLFRDIARHFISQNETVVITGRHNPFIRSLLNDGGFDFHSFGKKKNNIILKYLTQVNNIIRAYRLIRSERISLGLGVSMTLPLISKYTSSFKTIAFDDDDRDATPTYAKYANMADVIMTPAALAHEKRGDHHLTYPGFHELVYLHPKRFTPDENILERLGVKNGEPYFVIRFNSFKAHHDIGEKGLSQEQKKAIIERLSGEGRIFISTEGDPGPDFEQYKLPVRPDEIHSVLYYAKMFVGDSQTMTSEAAILGTPALKCNTFAGRLSIPNELENKYGLCYAFFPGRFEQMMTRMNELLRMPGLKEEWQRRRQVMLAETIDVASFLIWFIGHFPQSRNEYRNDPVFWKRFQ